MYSNKIIRKFIELKAKNIPHEKICRELKVSDRTLTLWSRKYMDDILVQKQIELDEMKNSLNIADFQQLEFYSRIIDKCKTVFINSDFEKTECSDLFKLFNLAITQVQKCRFIDMEEVVRAKKERENERRISLFNPSLFQNLK